MFKYSELIKNNIRYKLSTIALFAISALSLINIFTIIVFERHFGFCYYLTNIFAQYSWEYIISHDNLTKEIIIVAITVFSTVPYIICGIFARKRPLFTMIAVILLFLDSLMFCVDFIGLVSVGHYGYLIDFIIRIVAGVLMVKYILDGRELWYTIKDADSLEEIFGEMEEIPVDEEAESINVRKLHLYRKSEMWGFLTNCEVLIDGESRGFIRSGENKSFDLTVSAHELMVIAQNGAESESISVENGRENVVFLLGVRPKLFQAANPIITEHHKAENPTE